MKKVSTLNMTRDEWLSIRNKSIGGSDAAAVIGLNDYKSPYYLFCEKTGKIAPEDLSDKEAVRLGNDLEDYVARRWSEATGKKIRRDNNILYNEEYQFAHANVDRLVVNEKSGLECKTSSSFEIAKKLKNGEIPNSWYVQICHYLMVTGAERWYLGALAFGCGFFEFTIERDEAEISALAAAEKEFWDHVTSGVPPAADGAQSTTDALTTIYADSIESTCNLFGRETLLAEYMVLKQRNKENDARIAEIQNIICEEMQDAERGECGAYTVSWKAQERSTFQRKEFEKAHPEIDLSQYFKTSKSRPFKVTENKE